MPDRVSLIEQYDNRDVIAQIYRIINIAEHGAIETLVATKEGSSVKLIFTMHDGTKHEITFESNGVKDVYAVQSGSTETVHVVLDDDTDKTFTFDIAIAGVTTDTQQTITARKTFTAPQTFSGGIEGTTMIDGDVQISNGHSLSVAGDIDTAGDLQIAGNAEFLGNVEAGGMAIEESNGRTVLSNPNGVRMEGQLSLDAMIVAGMTIGKSEDRATILDNDDPIRVPHALEVRTTITGTRDSEAVNGIRLQNDLDNYAPMVRDTGNKTIYGDKDFEIVGVRELLRWKTCYCKQTFSADQYMPICKLRGATVSDGYFEAHVARVGRGRPWALFRLVWTRGTSLVKEVTVGEVVESYGVIESPTGDYYLGVKVNMNICLYHTILMMRNAGFDVPFEVVWTGVGIDTSTYTIHEVTP